MRRIEALDITVGLANIETDSQRPMCRISMRSYIEACRRAITRLRPMTQTINAVAYGDDQITWVHIIHVGGPGKNHINDWFEGNGTQGQKRIALTALLRTRIHAPHTFIHAPHIIHCAPPPMHRHIADDRSPLHRHIVDDRSVQFQRDLAVRLEARSGEICYVCMRY